MKRPIALKRLYNFCTWLAVTIMLSGLSGWMAESASAATVYCKVDSDAAGANNGTSWANAYRDLQSALTAASTCTEIWVAAGVYKPAAAGNRSGTFLLKNGVALYGGFAGTETVREQRNPAQNPTILSGDIDNNDSQRPVIIDLGSVTGNASNSYQVVNGASGATLDGFIITAGYANGNASFGDDSGGGLHNLNASPALANLTFIGNRAAYGGGMSNYGSSPTTTDISFTGNSASTYGGGTFIQAGTISLIRVTFSSNSAGSYGGGIYNNSSTLALLNVTFNGNRAQTGGGIYTNLNSPALTNVTFNANSAGANGGGLFNSQGTPKLTNVTFNANSAGSSGGGMSNDSGSPTLNNVTFKGNYATQNGGGMYNSYSPPTVNNSILWGNTAGTGGPQIQNSPIPGATNAILNDNVIQGGCPDASTCTHILSTDPLLGTLGNFGGFTQTIPIFEGSSAIDTGNDSTCASPDQRGVSRPQGAHCDMGSFEYQFLRRIFLPLVSRQ